MSIAYQTTVELGLECCCNCGVTFGMPLRLQTERLRDGKTFYCPNGHGQHYGDGENAKLKRQVAQLTSSLDQQRSATQEARRQTEATERKLSAQKGVTTRLKNKVALGLCPCCDKLFTDLESHMKSDHPDFEKTDEPANDATAS